MSDATGERATGAVKRREVGDAREGDGKLYYAQVREDPQLEIEALLGGGRAGRVLAVSSGGCTSLSLLAAGAREVVSIDYNPVQNHLVELKAGAVASLGADGACRFLGGFSSSDRWDTYQRLRRELSIGARAHWDGRRKDVERGVLGAGVTEHFVHGLSVFLRASIHSRARIERLFACRSLEEQAAYYRETWNSRRWRMLFPLLLNRWIFRKAYDPSFFAHVDNPSYARHFYGLLENALTALPVRENYFLRFMLLDEYPQEVPGGLPPYLTPEGARSIAERLDSLTLIDGDIATYLESCEPASFDAIAASNVGEWMAGAALDRLTRGIVRALRPGGRVCVRNFLGWTELPEAWKSECPELAAFPDKIRDDRSAVQRRFAVCERTEAGGGR